MQSFRMGHGPKTDNVKAALIASQEETSQHPVRNTAGLKRKILSEEEGDIVEGQGKRIKISLGPAVDLGD